MHLHPPASRDPWGREKAIPLVLGTSLTQGILLSIHTLYGGKGHFPPISARQHPSTSYQPPAIRTVPVSSHIPQSFVCTSSHTQPADGDTDELEDLRHKILCGRSCPVQLVILSLWWTISWYHTNTYTFYAIIILFMAILNGMSIRARNIYIY